jgi:hypothetical protein
LLASETVEDLRVELQRILKRSLRKDPTQRIKHMDDLKLALEGLIEESRAVGPAPPVAPRTKPVSCRMATT